LHYTTQWFTSKRIADFIQFAIASTGHRGEIIEEPIIDNRYHDVMLIKSKKYCVSWYNHCTVGFNYNHTSEKLPINEYQTKDGFEYCFTVPSNKLVLRRKNKIFVTGNCGKTTTANGIFEVFNRNQILACALSGKASVRITEATGLQAKTIHKTLGFNGHGFEYASNNQLKCKCFLIDESTMVNGTLFLQVLKAIPTGATLIMCGDIKQLTPIGNCQVFYDILRHSDMQVIELTKPHRQALKSGIITTSLAISSQQQILNYNDHGVKVFGELQDMVVKIQPDRTTIFDEVINTFMAELKTDDIMETQIIVAVRNRGDVSCYSINTKVQELVNPKIKVTPTNVFATDEQEEESNNQLEIKVYSHTLANEKYYYYIRIGDKVINAKNNYECINTFEEVTPVFNGNIGIVKDINSNECVIDFVGIGEVIFNSEEWCNLELAYALTCHKTQGSGFNKVIVGLDSNSYLMNYSEWLYTALTRAKKKCVLVSTQSTIYQTIIKKETRKKQTFLGSFLKLKEEPLN
jgi:exodeoxyribonuclease V alpha subunit